MEDIIKAAVLGIVEGLTEYIPVSSTGHLLLMQHFFGFGDEGFGNTFAVLIQFGAILALLSIYFVRLCGSRLASSTTPPTGASCSGCCSPSCRPRWSARSRTTS